MEESPHDRDGEEIQERRGEKQRRESVLFLYHAGEIRSHRPTDLPRDIEDAAGQSLLAFERLLHTKSGVKRRGHIHQRGAHQECKACNPKRGYEPDHQNKDHAAELRKRHGTDLATQPRGEAWTNQRPNANNQG